MQPTLLHADTLRRAPMFRALSEADCEALGLADASAGGVAAAFGTFASLVGTGTTYVVIPANSGPFRRTIQIKTIVETPLPTMPNNTRQMTALIVTLAPSGAAIRIECSVP